MNKRMLHRAVALIAVVLGWACAVSARAEESSVLNDIRFGERAGEVTRVVFDLEGAPDYSIFTLAGDGADRLVIDFDRLTFAVRQAGELGGRGDGRGRVARYRYAHNSTDASRVVLDLKQPVAVSEAFVIEPSGGDCASSACRRSGAGRPRDIRGDSGFHCRLARLRQTGGCACFLEQDRRA